LAKGPGKQVGLKLTQRVFQPSLKIPYKALLQGKTAYRIVPIRP